jgi:hypothetical protein
MWLLQWLPNWIFYAVLITGVFGLFVSYFIRFLSFIPLLYVYKTPIQLGSIIAIAIGTFMAGAIHNNESWLSRVKEMEAKGLTFDSDLHEAIANIPAPEAKLKGKVIEDVERGYFLNDKVLRFAKVVVGQ